MAKLMRLKRKPAAPTQGFTLIEIMLVIALIGIIATMVKISFSPEKPEDRLQHVTERFSSAFSLAADYALLNNVELGVYLDDHSYRFLGFDGATWANIPEQDFATQYSLPEGIEMQLQLDDLPIEEPLLFDAKTLQTEQEKNDKENVEKEKSVIPQIYILSGGDITPFSLTFSFVNTEMLPRPFTYKVTGIYDSNLTIAGPVYE